METLLPGAANGQSYSPQLKTVLKTYQLSAVKSLQGPSSALLGMDCKGLLQEPATFHFSPLNRSIDLENGDKTEDARVELSLDDSDEDPQPARVKGVVEKREFQIPILTASDQSCSERCETVLEGERISCFVVGGERRLCLPQILNTVLQDFSLQQINQVCDELQIYCSRCTRDQLEELKLSGILPRNAPSCGLITQTDAERLVSALLLRTEPCEPVVPREKLGSEKEDEEEEDDEITRFKVYHECFGKCKGILDSELFTSEDSACIQCLECGCQFSPQHFVRHAHRSLENRTCHWGFDSANWRSYLLLARDQLQQNKVATLFRDLKERRKRKPEIRQEPEKLIKRAKKETGRDDCSGGVYNGNGLGMYHPVSSAANANDPYLQMQWAVFELATRGASAFRPWSVAGSCKHRDSSPLVPAYLSRGPPVLQHPERVVPLSECERFEPHFQPNVALAPILPPAVAPVPPPLAHHHRRHHHERRRNNHRHPSPEDKPEPVSITVKLEKPSSPGPEVGTASLSSPPQLSCTSESEQGGCRSSQQQEEKDEEVMGEEEESSAAVTSSTVTVDPLPAEVETSSPEVDSDSDATAAMDLEERLAALDVPRDVLALAKRVAAENARLRRHRHRDAREISRLRSQLQLQQVQSENSDRNSKNDIASASAADSTEGSDEAEAQLPSDKKESDLADHLAGNE